jgi:hypothetical protein
MMTRPDGTFMMTSQSIWSIIAYVSHSRGAARRHRLA